ncbi:hypothetical protein HY251_01105 [bacterium]|nr:hypothetical protein [bacterium]
MLVELSVRDFVLIEHATLELGPGLTVVSGGTGDGKTLLLRSLRFLLGERAVPDRTVRAGAGMALVEGLFRVESAPLREELRGLGAPDDWDEPDLVLSRSLDAQGRGRARIGGRLATAGDLRSVGGRLVDFLSQHEYQSLASPERQRRTLDRLGSLDALRSRFAEGFAALRAAARARDALSRESEGARERDALRRSELEALRALSPEPGEHEDLLRARERLASLDAIGRALDAGHDRLTEREGAALDLVQATARDLAVHAPHSPAIARVVETLTRAAAELSDAASEVAREQDRLELDPSRLDEVEERLDAFRSLARRLGRPGERPAEPGELASRWQALEASQGPGADDRPLEARLAELDRDLAERATALDSLGDELSRGRRAAAKALERSVQQTLRQLALGGARLTASLREVERGPSLSAPAIAAAWGDLRRPRPPAASSADGGEGAGAEAAVASRFPSSSGLERLELQFAATKGAALLPLGAVASGGELARVCLALKRALAEADDVPVLVFDEVDQNTGGRLGAAIGRTLASIGRARQVLAVTHLPSVAAFAPRHVLVEKRGGARTTLREVRGDERLHELALMIRGEPVSRVALEQARELLSLAGHPRRRSKKHARGRAGATA